MKWAEMKEPFLPPQCGVFIGVLKGNESLMFLTWKQKILFSMSAQFRIRGYIMRVTVPRDWSFQWIDSTQVACKAVDWNSMCRRTAANQNR